MTLISKIASIALAALMIRWIYALSLFATMGEPGLTGADSIEYLATARNFADAITAGSVKGLAWLGPYPVMMPLFTWILTSCVLLFGSAGAPLGYVLLQGIFDSATCLLVIAIAQSIIPRYAVAAGMAAAINPTQIVLSGYVYSDSVFVFFCALFLFASVRWLQSPALRWSLLIGFGIGAAALCRVLVVPFAPILMIFLFAVALWQRRPWHIAFAQLVAAAGIVGIFSGLILARNVMQYEAWSLTPQGGSHLALWVVPLVKEAKDGTIWAIGSEQIKARKEARFGPQSQNPFQESKNYSTIAKEMLPELGVTALTKAWVLGAVINLAAPAVTISPPVARLPRTGFYGTSGNSTLEKIGNYLFRSDNALYAWIVLAGILGVIIMRFLQLNGGGVLLRNQTDWRVITLFGLWSAYILVINGPIASPKYRLPIEPIIVILTAAGFCATHDWIRNRRNNRVKSDA